MKSGDTARSASRTAEYVALVRQLAGFDVYAHHFVPRDYAAVGAVLERLDPKGSWADRIALGLNCAIRTRHRWLDCLLVEAVAADAQQVVLLGSGFDARPWRFADAIGERPVFLVDHPATASARAERGPDEMANVRRVDVRFDEEDFADRLDDAGFDWEQVAIFVWEGVTMYLPREVVASTLQRIALRAAPGSRIGFDLVAARPSAERPLRERITRRIMAAMSEPVMPGYPVDEMAGFIESCGLEPLRIVAAEKAPGGEGAWPDLYLVEARVPG